MNNENYDEESTRIIEKAVNLAYDNDNSEVYNIHLLKAILNQEDNLAITIINLLNVSINDLKNKTDAMLSRMPKVTGNNVQVTTNQGLRKSLVKAESQASKLGDEYVSPEHLLLGLSLVNDDVSQLLNTFGLTYENILKGIQKARMTLSGDENTQNKQFKNLEKYCIDLTKAAKEDKIDPIIGRDEEIRRVMQVLCRRTKNNPVIIDEPGVGKTAIVEGVARRIASGDVPDSLKNKRLLSLDLGLLVAGASYVGQFEDRMKNLLKDIKNADGSIILFIDELHNLVGAGSSSSSNMDAANLLKPALARGELRTIGATTLNEYHKYIEKDAALERRFQQVYCAEPTVEDTIAILRGLREKYEIHHGVIIEDEALVEAAVLSNRYITNRFLPDKAIDLVDEAASCIKMQIESQPEEIDYTERKIHQLEMEKLSLAKETDQASKDRLEKLELELNEIKSKFQGLKSQWTNEKLLINEERELKEKYNQAKYTEATYVAKEDYIKACEYKYGVIPELEKQIQKNKELIAQLQASNKMFYKQSVTEEDIARIVSNWTGIPLNKMMASEKEKYLQLEKVLQKRVVGQDYALQAVSDSIRRSRSGLSDPNKPLGSFLFVGPTGVGKTELAKTLADFLFDDEKAMIRLDMSEYYDKYTVSRLIGAAPGYVGYEEGGQLTEAVRRRPYSVVLFDEIEKANPDVFNILLQILDDGILTDGQGRKVDFKNTIIIMTSNIGSDLIVEEGTGDEVKEKINKLLLKVLRPELLNRIDEKVMFQQLGKNEISGIVKIQLDRVQKRLDAKKLILKYDDSIIEFLCDKGYDPILGARPVKRAIQTYIENPLSKELISGKFSEDQNINMKIEKDKVVFY